MVIGARFFNIIGSAGEDGYEAALVSEISDAKRALKKIELLAENWPHLGQNEEKNDEKECALTTDFIASPLDPTDWSEFREQVIRLLDSCVDFLSHARDNHWRPMTDEKRKSITLSSASTGIGHGKLVDELITNVLPFGTGNIHPRFFGWVHGTGLASGLLSEIVASTMNSNCGGRDHGAIYIEREVVEWCRQCFGFPETASGLLVSGTSQATVIALAAARTKVLGIDSRSAGIRGFPPLAAYAAQGIHSSTAKALELLGMGTASLRVIKRMDDGCIDLEHLRETIDADRSTGILPLCIIGTAGSVDTGFFDNLHSLADFCSSEKIWFHIDGAFGAWVRLAGDPWKKLANGIERADSLAFDFHKWMFVQYDCGAVLIRQSQIHRQTFASRPAYLEGQDAGLGGGEPWYCDYGIDLSRNFRALKVWSALKTYGSGELGKAITRTCELAFYMATLIENSGELQLSAPVISNICCFSAVIETMAEAETDRLNLQIVRNLQMNGDVVFSTTKLAGRVSIRAALVNHRTCNADIEYAVHCVIREKTVLLSGTDNR
ncbi:MAG: amino acid decarboxylase [Chlorobiaceae bacterium]|nr:amino acid decarboxylase [Chlorobiaceae bacterium]NTV60374.1 amino acid decarboxylase [Chlorobiaceae bacterium]